MADMIQAFMTYCLIKKRFYIVDIFKGLFLLPESNKGILYNILTSIVSPQKILRESNKQSKGIIKEILQNLLISLLQFFKQDFFREPIHHSLKCKSIYINH